MINTKAPWLYHIHPDILSHFTGNTINLENLHKQLNQLLKSIHSNCLQTGMGQPLRFVSQSVLDDLNNTKHPAEQREKNAPISIENIATAYETHIANTGEIPTRDNLHDLFNAWVWLTFPKTKAMLNRYQSEQIAKDGISGSRGKVRDAITLLDENGAVLITSDDTIGKALKGFDWQNCLVAPRSQWVNMDSPNQTHTPKAMVMICGHALLEQLVHPRKPLCSHTFILNVEGSFFKQPLTQQVRKADALLCEQVEHWLQQEDVSPRQLSPLPILGVPFFYNDNANKAFYDDSFVFRSGRQRKKK